MSSGSLTRSGPFEPNYPISSISNRNKLREHSLVFSAFDGSGEEFYIDEKLITTKSMAPYSFVWESQKYTDGPYQILARVFDLTGNTSTDGVSIIVRNTKKTRRRR